jgi:hypothetical protein
MNRIIALLALMGALAIPQGHAAPAGTIPGTVVHRHNDTWLGIQLTANNFFVTFYDKSKNPMAADAESVVLSWTYPHAAGGFSPALSTQLTPEQDISSVFTSGYSVPYPHKMTLRVTLAVPAASTDAQGQVQTEVYVVKFTGNG